MPAAASGVVEQNSRERERMRALVSRLTDEQLTRPVTDQWTVADMLGHMAFWDARALSLAEKLEAGNSFTAADHEPDDVDPINAAAHALLKALPSRQVAELAVRLAEETDRRVADLDPHRLWPEDPESPLNPLRAGHRAEHLDDIEAALG
ncbi:MAG TPA: maleylpyruvate isomerase N-terminal domain-containing protein [Candidatus Dormibacteraeota bacterium]